MRKKTVLLDMDETLYNFRGSVTSEYERAPPCMYEPGFFKDLEPIEGARRAVAHLQRSGLFEIYVCTQPLADSPLSYTEKVQSIAKHFPSLLEKIIMVQDKGMIFGDVMVDDSATQLSSFAARNLHAKTILFDPLGDVGAQWKEIVNTLIEEELNERRGEEQ